MGLQHLPDSSRIWIFTANRKLDTAELSALNGQLDIFVSSWKAHGKELSAGYEIQYQCLLVLAVDESAEAPSGCSIDKAFRLLQEFGAANNVDFFQRTTILRVAGDHADLYNKSEAQEAWNSGSLNADDMVVDTLLANLGKWRAKPLIPFAESWLGKTQLA